METRRVNTRKRKLPDLPLCKYGSSCYQKSAEHLKNYRHPEKPLVETQNKMSKYLTVPVVPDQPSKKSCVHSPRKRRSPSPRNNRTATPRKSPLSSPRKSPAASPEKKSSVKAEVKEKVVKTIMETKLKESVKDVLDSMPQDFFDFWDFCCTINKSKPQDAFSELGLHLVGIYDLLSNKLPKKQEILLHCHWRYFYDPPEFQTVVKLDGKDLYHIGYFRDDPSEKPSILASNSVALGSKLTLKGDNIFAAMYLDLTDIIKKLKAKEKKSKFSKILEDLKEFAKNKKYSLEIQSTKVKARSKKVVAKTFNGLGIVVPVKNNVGYRPLPDSDATIKSLLKRIISVEDLNKRLEVEEDLDELVTNIQFANDECDYGMGLELGIDLFSFGDPYFHPIILHLLPLAYDLLKRPKYGEIIRCHLANRKKHDKLDDLIKAN
ncbi:hypothetical protein JTE90_023788 [Oedothorax gibbosus]|uniref:PBZ-type domain-containing protein n=1 Tax=Oedothorax gibbosus TaxID=931172 RepID=A0AAV6USX3_9ARAC|nr:hypothetical protein JTE90_023788 [Oedothorax gibbosus]